MEGLRGFRELKVWQKAMDMAMLVFEFSGQFPKHELYSLTDQVCRSSRSVPANIAEAWRKRRYPAAFVSKLNDAEGEAAETQTHVEMALRCGYLSAEQALSPDTQPFPIHLLDRHRSIGSLLHGDDLPYVAKTVAYYRLPYRFRGIPVSPL